VGYESKGDGKGGWNILILVYSGDLALVSSFIHI
jgi:hypothetical protein